MNNRWKPRNEYILFGGEKLKEDFGRKQQKYPYTKNVTEVERGPEPMRTEEWHDVNCWVTGTDRGSRWTRPEGLKGICDKNSLGDDGRGRTAAAADQPKKSWIHYVIVPRNFWGKGPGKIFEDNWTWFL